MIKKNCAGNIKNRKTTVSNFHKGSLANRNGIYNDVPDYIYLKKFETPLISKFYPLIE
jgi:hypothetical protein